VTRRAVFRLRMRLGMLERVVRVVRLGQVGYRQAYQLQNHLVRLVKQDGDVGSFILLLQHTPVYTTGIRTKDYSVEEEQRLTSLGAEFVRTNRGGLITFHGPGQLVAYPIMNLNNFVPQANRRKAALGMKWYVNTLEEVIIKVCSEFGLAGTRSPHTGVWLADDKVCAIGVHSTQLITSHGLALNVNTDLKWFQNIVPCGIVGKGVTSLSRQLGRQVGVDEVSPLLVKHFQTEFGASLVECSQADAQHIIPPDLGIRASPR